MSIPALVSNELAPSVFQPSDVLSCPAAPGAKFFRLLQRATYLQACMMHMVIPLIRVRGLRILYARGRGGKDPAGRLSSCWCIGDGGREGLRKRE